MLHGQILRAKEAVHGVLLQIGNSYQTIFIVCIPLMSLSSVKDPQEAGKAQLIQADGETMNLKGRLLLSLFGKILIMMHTFLATLKQLDGAIRT